MKKIIQIRYLASMLVARNLVLFRPCLSITTAVTLAATAGVITFLALPLSANGDPPRVIDDATLRARTTTIGGARVLQTTRTVPHWFGSTLDPNNGIIYGYNMVGANPNTCSGTECDVTVTVDVIPVNLVVEGEPFNGSDVVDATLASPVFALNDYGSTPFATAPGAFPNQPLFIRGLGGVLSQNDAGNQLQLQDATMRAQFNKTGSSSYHLRLNPVVHDAITIVVPQGQGTVFQTQRGVHAGAVKIAWFATRIQNLDASLSYIDPTRLPIYLTRDVFLYLGNDLDDPDNCCIFGFHSAGTASRPLVRSQGGNGNEPVQTFAWASYLSPGVFAGGGGGNEWALQDISGLSHEIAEWADDPFDNNFVEPWLTPTAPQYGCTDSLETGDPVVAIGFAMGTNIYFQSLNPDGTQSADGYYHPEDQVFLPWFMRLAPNNICEPTQSSSPNIGRYSLMGDRNPFVGFRRPATGCE